MHTIAGVDSTPAVMQTDFVRVLSVKFHRSAEKPFDTLKQIRRDLHTWRGKGKLFTLHFNPAGEGGGAESPQTESLRLPSAPQTPPVSSPTPHPPPPHPPQLVPLAVLLDFLLYFLLPPERGTSLSADQRFCP